MDWREIGEKDLIECLQIEPRAYGDEIVGRERALSVWKEWTRSLVFNSAVIETNGALPGSRKIAFGASVFVSSEFADRELQHPQPGLNSRLIASVVSGLSFVCPEIHVSGSGASSALDAVILSCHYLYEAMSDEEVTQAEMMLPASFFEEHIGYRLNRILVKTVNTRQRKVHESSGVWRVVKEFPDCDRALMMLARGEALSVSGSIAAPLFQYHEPLLRLRDTEKQLLAEAMNGETDQELAAKINLSLPTIKKRWASLFDRIGEVRPDLLPDAGQRNSQETRGPQKRHRILAYVRAHPEEVRPYRWRSNGHA